MLVVAAAALLVPLVAAGSDVAGAAPAGAVPASGPAPVRTAGPLTPRLLKLSQPAFRSLPRLAQSRALSVPAAGPGSLVTRPDGSLLVDMRLADTSSATLVALRAAGADLVRVNRALGMAAATVQPAALQALAAVPQVLAVMEVPRPVQHASCPTGIVSEGDSQLKAGSGRAAYSVDGAGVTVGVLSDSYNARGGAIGDVTAAELPGLANPCTYTTPVAVQADQLLVGNTDEGRAMAQIVHDLAPGAAIRFATAFDGDLDFAAQIRDLATAGAKVIVDDITYFNEPMYQDGVIGKAVEDVVAGGASYFSSAGNSNQTVGGREVGSYETPAFRSATCPAAVVAAEGAPSGLECHNFNGGSGAPDTTYGLTLSSSDIFILGWNEPQFGITTGLDLFLLNGVGAVVASSTDDNVGSTQQAFEFLQAPAGGTYSVVVARAQGTGTPRFKVVDVSGSISATEFGSVSGGDITGPATFGHNVSRSGASVAAVRFDNAATPEFFSSRGPAAYCWGPVSGSTPAAAISPCESATVDLSATDGTANSFFGQQGYAGVGDTTWRFFGTSAAAPHAAAVAALIRQRRPCLTPAGVLQAMSSTAMPVGAFGADAVGAGLVDAQAALGVPGSGVACPPVVTVNVPAPPASGWFTSSPVAASVSATDADLVTGLQCAGANVGQLTGTGTATATAPITVGSGVSHISCTATSSGVTGADVGSAATASVKVDSTPPVVSLAGARAGATYRYGAVPVATCPTTDALSGVATSAVASRTGPSSGLGTFTVRCSAARDKAGNVRAAFAATYRVIAVTTGVAAPRAGAAFRRGQRVTVVIPLTAANRVALPSATGVALARSHAVRAALRVRTATGRIAASVACTYSSSGRRFSCSVLLPVRLATGTYWIDVQQNLGWGFQSVPRAAGARLPNPVRILVR